MAQSVDQFIAAEGESLPFGEPEADKPEGFIQIVPPVDFNNMDTDRKITVTMETSKERDVDKEKQPEKAQKAEKAEKKKPSMKEKLAEGKAKSAKTKSPKKDTKKDLQEAI